ncbi:hypothetical protein GGI22_004854 [Coemansia erecta]|nr:hypothetical protein GGI22_004854 [Coemansia erecta]
MRDIPRRLCDLYAAGSATGDVRVRMPPLLLGTVGLNMLLLLFGCPPSAPGRDVDEDPALDPSTLFALDNSGSGFDFDWSTTGWRAGPSKRLRDEGVVDVGRNEPRLGALCSSPLDTGAFAIRADM